MTHLRSGELCHAQEGVERVGFANHPGWGGAEELSDPPGQNKVNS